MYVVLDSHGQQLKVESGQTLRVDYMGKANEGDKIVFDKVLMLSDGASVRFGTPYVPASVHATVLGHDRTKKVIVYKKKKRTDSHRKMGHRQRFTTIHIDSIEA